MSRPLYLSGQCTKEVYIAFFAEEHGRLGSVVRQHTPIVVTIQSAPAFVGFYICVEGNVIAWRQKIRPDQAPASRQDIEAFQPVLFCQ